MVTSWSVGHSQPPLPVVSTACADRGTDTGEAGVGMRG